MNESMLQTPLERSHSDNTESDRLLPPTKRLCASTNNSKLSRSNSISSAIVDRTSVQLAQEKNDCKACGKDETLLQTFNCPSSHNFCLNCIFTWTQKHVQVSIQEEFLC